MFTREADFRVWFEANLDRFGVKRVILSQEACPDYVLEMTDGRIAKVEAELFAVNFRYHKHDPSKVDFILACYSKSEAIDGVPVVSLHRLWTWDLQRVDPLPPDGPLTRDELRVLRTVHGLGSVALAALGQHGGHNGDQAIWMRFPPETISNFPRGQADDGLLTVMPPATKAFIKKHHHALLAAGLSAAACNALESLQRRDLIGYRPIAFLSAAMDGGIIDHPAWLPTEVYEKPNAMKYHRDEIHHLFWRDEPV